MYNKPITLGIGLVAYKYKYFLDKNHPLGTGSDGIVLYHRHVASIARGSWLVHGEQVHHIDNNTINNNPDNLQVLTAQEHNSLHNTIYKKETRICVFCNTGFISSEQLHTKYCSASCKASDSIKDKSLTKSYLEQLLPYHTWVSLSNLTGYSDNGIKKRAKTLGCDVKLIRTKLGHKH